MLAPNLEICKKGYVLFTMDMNTLRNRKIANSLCHKFLQYTRHDVDPNKIVSTAEMKNAVQPEALAIAMLKYGYADVTLEDVMQLEGESEQLFEMFNYAKELSDRFASMVVIHQRISATNKLLAENKDLPDRAELGRTNMQRVKVLLGDIDWLHSLLEVEDQMTVLVKSALKIAGKAVAKMDMTKAERS